MQTAILTLHVIVCLVLIVLVLLQSGREGMGVIFGGGGNSSVFGTSGAGGMLVKLTTFLAVLFIVTSLGYNILTSPARDDGSDILDVQFETVVPAPAQPEQAVPSTDASNAVSTPTASPADVSSVSEPESGASDQAVTSDGDRVDTEENHQGSNADGVSEESSPDAVSEEHTVSADPS